MSAPKLTHAESLALDLERIQKRLIELRADGVPDPLAAVDLNRAIASVDAARLHLAPDLHQPMCGECGALRRDDRPCPIDRTHTT